MRLGVAAAVVDGALVRGDVEVADGVVAAVGLEGGDGSGLAVPGLVDLQVNGFAGVDFLQRPRRTSRSPAGRSPAAACSGTSRR